MRDKIIIGEDVFSVEYWQHDRVRSLVDAFADMLATEPSPDKYITWWLSKCGGTYSDALAASVIYTTIASDIRDNGYDPTRWESSDRNFDPAKGQGPITVKIGPDGTISPWDGAHRSAILRVLGRTVEAEVFERADEWQHLKEYHKTLYTPYPHPDFASHPVTRRGTERFEAIERNIGGAPGDIVVLGACTGFGAAYLQRRYPVIAVEPTDQRRAMLTHWFHRLGDADSPYLNISAAYAHEVSYGGGTVVALSVLQHAATCMSRMQEIATAMRTSPQLAIELPGDDEKQWHHQFRDETKGCLQSAVIDALIQAGGYDPPKVIYTDHTYANRQTLLLERQ